MQLTQKIFPDSAIFIEKKTVENQLWAKSDICRQKEIFIYKIGYRAATSERECLACDPVGLVQLDLS